MTRRRNVIVATLGRKGTGKSVLLWELYSSRAERLLSLDSLGESVERDPDTIETLGMGQLIDALGKAAAFPRWHIAGAVEPDDLKELFRMLAPPLGSSSPSLSLAFGGLAIECGEAYEIAPNGSAAPEVLRAWRAGRHYSLSLFMAAQRPSSVAREVTAAADHVYAFAQSEPRDLEFLAKTISAPVADRVAQLRHFECVHYDRDRSTATVLDRDRNPVMTINTMGDSVQENPLGL